MRKLGKQVVVARGAGPRAERASPARRSRVSTRRSTGRHGVDCDSARRWTRSRAGGDARRPCGWPTARTLDADMHHRRDRHRSGGRAVARGRSRGRQRSRCRLLLPHSPPRHLRGRRLRRARESLARAAARVRLELVQNATDMAQYARRAPSPARRSLTRPCPGSGRTKTTSASRRSASPSDMTRLSCAETRRRAASPCCIGRKAG